MTLRVAFIIVGDTSRLTGGYLYNARLLAGLRELGVEVEEVVASGASPGKQAAAAPRFGATLDPAGFDVVVVDALARIVCAPHLDRWREARPVVAMIHELPSAASPEPLSDREVEEPLLRADLLVAVSPHGKSILEERGVPAERIRVVPPGFDRLAPVEGRASGPGRHKVRALCVAQWIPRKGVLELVRAWRSCQRPGAELVLIGYTDADPGYAARVRRAIGDDPSIIVSGSVSDAALREAYAAADLFALPSRYEGYGMVYAEALAFGLPIVTCEVGPVPELVGKDAAILLSPGDEEALSGALGLLLADPGLRRNMSVAARRRAENLPRWSDTVSGFWKVLQEAAGGSRKNERSIG